MVRKCPNCNSSKIVKNNKGMKCLKCGYINKIKLNNKEENQGDI